MNSKTLAAITKHGQSLLRAFPNSTEQNPVVLCKKLRRIETAVYKPILDYTNGDNGVTTEQVDAACDKAVERATKLLGKIPTVAVNHTNGNCPDCNSRYGDAHADTCKGGNHSIESILHVNRDPRGHALKLDDNWTRKHNDAMRKAGDFAAQIHSDMGGYGILAPNLNQ